VQTGYRIFIFRNMGQHNPFRRRTDFGFLVWATFHCPMPDDSLGCTLDFRFRVFSLPSEVHSSESSDTVSKQSEGQSQDVSLFGRRCLHTNTRQRPLIRCLLLLTYEDSTGVTERHDESLNVIVVLFQFEPTDVVVR